MPKQSSKIPNGVKLMGEMVVPGASLFLEGKLAEGATHLVVGLGARLLLGPLGHWAVSSDSYMLSVKGRHVWELDEKAARRSVRRRRSSHVRQPKLPVENADGVPLFAEKG